MLEPRDGRRESREESENELRDADLPDGRPGGMNADRRGGQEEEGRESRPGAEARKGPLFPLGGVFGTPGSIAAMERSGTVALRYIHRHASGDWGELDEEDRAANDRAVLGGGRVLSVYDLPNQERIWIITEWDRSVTTVLLPSEY